MAHRTQIFTRHKALIIDCTPTTRQTTVHTATPIELLLDL